MGKEKKKMEKIMEQEIVKEKKKLKAR